jgi:hypothetical protein
MNETALPREVRGRLLELFNQDHTVVEVEADDKKIIAHLGRQMCSLLVRNGLIECKITSCREVISRLVNLGMKMHASTPDKKQLSKSDAKRHLLVLHALSLYFAMIPDAQRDEDISQIESYLENKRKAAIHRIIQSLNSPKRPHARVSSDSKMTTHHYRLIADNLFCCGPGEDIDLSTGNFIETT